MSVFDNEFRKALDIFFNKALIFGLNFIENYLTTISQKKKLVRSMAGFQEKTL